MCRPENKGGKIMEKVLDIVKGLFAGFVELLMHPVSKVTEAVQKEDIKKGAIKAAIIAAVLAIVNVLSTIRVIHIKNSTSKIRDAYMEALNPFLSILKMFAIYLLAIIVVALILFIISKLVKDQKSLPYTLSMTVNSAIIYTVGLTLGLILSFWTPLSILVIGIASLHSGLTLVISFVSSLSSVDTDSLVLVTVVVLMAVSIVMAIINLVTKEVKLNDYADNKYMNNTQYSDLPSKAYKKLNSSSIEDAYDLATSIINQ